MLSAYGFLKANRASYSFSGFHKKYTGNQGQHGNLFLGWLMNKYYKSLYLGNKYSLQGKKIPEVCVWTKYYTKLFQLLITDYSFLIRNFVLCLKVS